MEGPMDKAEEHKKTNQLSSLSLNNKWNCSPITYLTCSAFDSYLCLLIHPIMNDFAVLHLIACLLFSIGPTKMRC